MNRTSHLKEPAGSQHQHRHRHRRGLSLTSAVCRRDTDDDLLHLFSRNRRNASVSDDQSDVKLGTTWVDSAKVARNGIDNLLSSSDGGKHDYDWLLTPPGTPLFPSLDGTEPQPASTVHGSSSVARSLSTTKASRLSVSQSESNHPSRPARSSSVSRASISSPQYSYYSNKSSSILSTSSASVSSYIRQSTPTSRSSSTARPLTPSARPSTPSKVRSAPTNSSLDKTRPAQNSRPSTPSSSPQISANLTSPSARSTSRPSTPMRRNPAPPVSPATGTSASVGRTLPNVRNAAPSSRPSSPGPQVRPPAQPIVLRDFPLDTPSNLRTTLPDRPLSAGRSRPGVGMTVKGSTENPSVASLPRRHSSPIVTRGRVSEPSARGRVHTIGQLIDTSESRTRKPLQAPELSTRKPVKTSTESTGFGRSISKKSLDMAIRHMDIRNGTSGIRSLSSSTLFPQSIRSTSSKSDPGHTSSAPPSANGNLTVCAPSSVNPNQTLSGNRINYEYGNHIHRSLESGTEEDKSQNSARLTEVDVYESSRYDAILLKEDLNNTNWLHCVDDKFDQEPIFDNGFELLPEPFGPL